MKREDKKGKISESRSPSFLSDTSDTSREDFYTYTALPNTHPSSPDIGSSSSASQKSRGSIAPPSIAIESSTSLSCWQRTTFKQPKAGETNISPAQYNFDGDINDENQIPLDSFTKSFFEFSRYAFPNVGSDIVIVGTGFASAIILSYVNKQTIAASSLIELLYGIILDLSAAGLTSVSLHAIAKKETGHFLGAGNILFAGWAINLLLTAVMIPIFLNVKSILVAAGQSEEISSIVQDFFNGFSVAVLPLLGILTNRQFFIATERPNVAFLLVLINSIITLAVGYALTLGAFDGRVEARGALGMGIANAIAAWPCFIASCLLLLTPSNRRYFSRLSFYSVFSTQFLRNIGSLLKTGLPLTMTALSDFALTLTVNFSVGALGENSQYLLPQGVINEYLVLALAKIFSVGETLATLFHGILANKSATAEQKHLKIFHFFWAGLLLAGTLSVTWFLLFATIPDQLLSFFCGNECDQSEISLFRTLALMTGVGLLIDTTRIVANGALIGIEDEMSSTKINFVFLMLLAVPAISLTTTFSPQADLDLIWTINAIKIGAIILSSQLMTLRWYSEFKVLTSPVHKVHGAVTDFILKSVKFMLCECGKNSQNNHDTDRAERETLLQLSVQTQSSTPLVIGRPDAIPLPHID